jgi:hypothetical protein
MSKIFVIIAALTPLKLSILHNIRRLASVPPAPHDPDIAIAADRSLSQNGYGTT